MCTSRAAERPRCRVGRNTSAGQEESLTMPAASQDWAKSADWAAVTRTSMTGIVTIYPVSIATAAHLVITKYISHREAFRAGIHGAEERDIYPVSQATQNSLSWRWKPRAAEETILSQSLQHVVGSGGDEHLGSGGGSKGSELVM